MIKKDRATTDWEAELTEQDVVENKEGKTFVLIEALRRLAKSAGLVRSWMTVNSNFSTKTGTMIVQCVYNAKFDDGTIWCAAADANDKNNIEEPFKFFPTCIAENRAEGRMYRKALGIRMLTSDEPGVHPGEFRPTSKIDTQQIKGIEEAIKRADLENNILTVLATVLGENRSDQITGLADLKFNEAQRVMRYLNDKVKKKTRSERYKAKLEASITAAENKEEN